MREAEVYVESERALTDVIGRVRDDQWGLHPPDWFQLAPTQDRAALTLRTIVGYHASDTAWVPDTLAGRTIAEVGDAWDGDLLGDDPRGGYARLAEGAIAAAERLDDPERTVHLSYGDFPAREYLVHITSFRGFRAYDIARMIGADPALPPGLVQGMWDLIVPQADQWRAWGVFGPAVPVAADAPLQDRLLGACGRDPRAG